MYTLKVQNAYDQILELTHNANYDVTDIAGLTPPAASVNRSTMATGNGSFFNGSRIGERNIVIEVYLKGDIEESRIKLYDYFVQNSPTKIFYKNSRRDVWIEGYVETMECGIFEQQEKAQISIVCPQPYFISNNISVNEFSNVTSYLEFPVELPKNGKIFSTLDLGKVFDVNNQGGECGVIIEILALGTVKKPYITNISTNETTIINKTMTKEWSTVINTNQGQKSVIYKHGKEEQNIILDRDMTSKWIHLRRGINSFTYGAERNAENMRVRITHTDRFEGV